MAIIGPIDELNSFRFRASGWRLVGGVINQRSAFTGRTRLLRLGPSARWTCDVEIAPTIDTASVNSRRNALAALALTDITSYVTAAEQAQAVSPVPATCQVDGAGQLGFSLNLKGLAASATNLVAGQMISVDLGDGDEQLLLLTLNNLVGNGSGLGTATFCTPLRRAPADNATVRLHWPRAVMRLTDPVGWNAGVGNLHEFPTLRFEEAF